MCRDYILSVYSIIELHCFCFIGTFLLEHDAEKLPKVKNILEQAEAEEMRRTFVFLKYCKKKKKS